MIYITYWLIYSFLGWVIETTYTSTLNLSFQDRGFLTLPFIPIYGFGAMITVVLLEPYAHNLFIVFVLGVFFTSLLEYITSYIMDRIFHMRWWDYSERFLNIHGRICIFNSMMFGILSVALVHTIHPFIKDLIMLVPHDLVHQVTQIVLVLVIFDFFHSIFFALTFSSVFNEIDHAEILPKKEYLELQERVHSLEHRILQKYPHLKEELILFFEGIKKPRR